MPELVLPSARYKQSFLEAVAELRTDTYQHGSILSVTEQTFDAHLRELEDGRNGRSLPEGFVPYSEYWLVDRESFIGRVSVRHMLNDHLRQIGGHIGYIIRPSKRSQGYGTHILALALQKARALGIQDVLLTCDETNVGSARIIEKNGGVLENVVPQGAGKPDKRRYWIWG